IRNLRLGEPNPRAPRARNSSVDRASRGVRVLPYAKDPWSPLHPSDRRLEGRGVSYRSLWAMVRRPPRCPVWSLVLTPAVPAHILNHMVQYSLVDQGFTALSDPTRRGILERLG